MKKNGKFVFGLLSAAAVAGGAYYFVKNILNKDSDDDFEDFEDDFEDFDFEDKETVAPSEGREYVTINITSPAEDKSEDTCEETVSCESTNETDSVEDVDSTEEVESAEEETTEA